MFLRPIFTVSFPDMIEKNGYSGVKDFFEVMALHLMQECEKENSIRTLRSKDQKRKFRKRRTRANILTHSIKENPKIKATRHLSLNEVTKHQPTKPAIPVNRSKCKLSLNQCHVVVPLVMI